MTRISPENRPASQYLHWQVDQIAQASHADKHLVGLDLNVQTFGSESATLDGPGAGLTGWKCRCCNICITGICNDVPIIRIMVSGSKHGLHSANGGRTKTFFEFRDDNQ